MELVITAVIVTLALALIVPRAARVPAGLQVRLATDQVRAAFRDAGSRARATGAPVRLLFDPTANRIRLDEPEASLDFEVDSEEAPTAGTGEPGRYNGPREYPLPRGLTWEAAPGTALATEALVFVFLPHGEASGPILEFRANQRRFQVSVDRLTGRPIVLEPAR